MLPSEESLPAGNRTGSQIEFGLKDEIELLAVHGAAHAVAKLQAFDGLRRHVFREEAERVSSLALGCIHRHIGILDERFRILAVVRVDADADAAGNAERIAVEVKRRLKFARDPLGRHRGIGERADRTENNQKFIAAEAGNGIVFTRTSVEPLCDTLQQFVATRVTETIIDDLETVDVEMKHCQLFAPAFRHGDGLGQAGRGPGFDWVVG